VIVALLLVLLPRRVKRFAARHLLGWDLDPSAHIGRSIVLVKHVSMGPGAVIGSFNVIRNLDELRMAAGAHIATRNFIACPPSAAQAFRHSPNRRAALIMGEHAMITVGHEIDCSDRVELGAHSAIAGFRSQVLTHSVNLMSDRQTTGPVEIGHHCAIMSGCLLLNGTRVPDRSVVSAGSVVTTKLTKELTFYRGNPAQPVRELPANLGYFRRGEE
jgi:acetyltransferase-like isoleucine patch superfamily enzyme